MGTGGGGLLWAPPGRVLPESSEVPDGDRGLTMKPSSQGDITAA